jgi:Ca2+-binding RTX toxin-like protein
MANIYGSPFNDNNTFNGGQFRPSLVGTANNDNIYGRAGNDLLYGDTGNDKLYGEAGNDSLGGGEGNDALNGGSGSDSLYGGNGDDTYIVDNVNDTIFEYEGGGSFDTVLSSVNYTLGAWLNNLTLTGAGSISGTGNELNNTIKGNDGNNTLDGGSGSDTLIGGKGDDTYIVDGTTDTILEYEGGGSFDTVKSSVSYTLGAWLNDLTLTGTSAINGTGNSLDNRIIGNEGDNILRGGAGNDTLGDGGGGNDRLYGGAGDDHLTGGSFDTDYQVYMDGGDGNDVLYSSGSGTLVGGNGNDSLSVTYGTLHGGNGNDILNNDEGDTYGGDGDDILSTYLGSLIGGNGNDTLTSDGGPYVGFVFNYLAEGVDTLVNFYPDGYPDDGDTIEVSASGFGGGLTPGMLAPEQFVIGSAATTSSHRFIYNSADGALFFDEDGLGATGQVQFAKLSTGLPMTNNDFSVFA